MTCRSAFHGLLLIALLGSLVSCSRFVYDGPVYPTTEKVDVYYAPKEITRKYEVMGLIKAYGTGLFSGSNLDSKLIKQARQKGADAILFEVEGSTITQREQSLTPQEQGMGMLSRPKEKTNWNTAYLLKYK